MATIYDQIHELTDMCRKLEEMDLADMVAPLRNKIAELAMPVAAAPVAPVAPAVAPNAEPPVAPRRAKRTIDSLIDLYRRGLLHNDEVCYIRTNDHEERYRIRFTNNGVVFFHPKEAKELYSPAAVSKHHASQIYEGHPAPTNPGNGWIHIKLLDRDNKSLADYCEANEA